MLARDDAAVWLADDASGSVLGMIALSWRPRLGLGGTIVTVDELVVGEASRDRGVGQALLQLARACARERSARRLELHTARARESYQRRFYVQRGFREVDSAVMRIDAPSEAW
jgi:GNAT superfamily N-acetyltransferase